MYNSSLCLLSKKKMYKGHFLSKVRDRNVSFIPFIIKYCEGIWNNYNGFMFCNAMQNLFLSLDLELSGHVLPFFSNLILIYRYQLNL